MLPAGARLCVGSNRVSDDGLWPCGGSVYTNSVAKISLDYASQVVSMFGGTPNPKWADLSSRLVILFNGTIHPEYAGYDGETIKQADVILLGFPLDIDFGNMSTVRATYGRQ